MPKIKHDQPFIRIEDEHEIIESQLTDNAEQKLRNIIEKEMNKIRLGISTGKIKKYCTAMKIAKNMSSLYNSWLLLKTIKNEQENKKVSIETIFDFAESFEKELMDLGLFKLISNYSGREQSSRYPENKKYEQELSEIFVEIKDMEDLNIKNSMLLYNKHAELSNRCDLVIKRIYAIMDSFGCNLRLIEFLINLEEFKKDLSIAKVVSAESTQELLIKLRPHGDVKYTRLVEKFLSEGIFCPAV